MAIPAAGLKLNLRGSSLTGANGSAVADWGGYAVTGGTVAAAVTPSGKNALRLPGTTSNKVALGDLMAGATAGEVMVMLKLENTADKGWATWGTAADNTHYPYGGTIYESFGNSNRPGFTPRSGLVLTDWHFYSVSTYASTSTVRRMVARQGTPSLALAEIGAHEATATNGAATFPTAMNLGSSVNGWFWNGTVAAIVIYDRLLTDAERTQVYDDIKAELSAATVDPKRDTAGQAYARVVQTPGRDTAGQAYVRVLQTPGQDAAAQAYARVVQTPARDTAAQAYANVVVETGFTGWGVPI